MVKALSAVVFDMDGVIIDSELHWKQAEPHFLRALAPDWKEKSYHQIIGRSIQDIHALLVREHGLSMGWPEFIEGYGRIAEDIYGRKVSLLDGFKELLSELEAARIPAALASSSPRRWIDMVIRRFGLAESFRAVVSADDLNGEGKPSPVIYLRAASLLGLPPEACVAIEDAKNGVVSAHKAGMACVGLMNGFSHEQDLSEAELVVESLRELSVPALARLAGARP